MPIIHVPMVFFGHAGEGLRSFLPPATRATASCTTLFSFPLFKEIVPRYEKLLVFSTHPPPSHPTSKYSPTMPYQLPCEKGSRKRLSPRYPRSLPLSLSATTIYDGTFTGKDGGPSATASRVTTSSAKTSWNPSRSGCTRDSSTDPSRSSMEVCVTLLVFGLRLGCIGLELSAVIVRGRTRWRDHCQ